MAPLTYSQLQSDPKFAQLSYDAQIQVRGEVLQDELRNDPKFLALSQAARLQVLERMIYAPPALVHKRTEQRVAGLGMSLEKGDPQAKMAIEATLGNEYAKEAGLIFGTFGRLFEKYALWSTKVTGQDQFQGYTPMGEKVAGGMQKLFGQSDTDPSALIFAKDAQEDKDRVMDYFSYLTSKDRKLGRLVRMREMGTPILGAFVDMGIIYPLLAGTYAAPQGLAKLAMKPFAGLMAKARLPGQRVLAKVLGEAAHGVATSALWVARENVRAMMEDPNFLRDSTWQEMVKSTGKQFGEAFLFDVVANLAVGVALPMMKSVAKNFKGWDKIDLLKGAFDEDQYRLLLQNAVTGKTIDPDLFARLPKVVQRRIDAGRSFSRVFTRVPRKEADDLFRAFSMAQGWTATPLKEGDELTGRWLMEYNGGGSARTLNNMGSAQKFLQDWLDDLTGEASASGAKPLKDAILSGSSYDRVRIRQVLKGYLKEGSERNMDVLAHLAAPKGNRWTPGQIKGFSRASLRAVGAGDDVVKAVKVLEEKNFLKVFVGDTQVGAFPKELRAAKQETDALEGFMKGIKAYSGDNYSVAEDLLKEYKTELVRQRLYTPEWVKHAVEKKLDAKLIEPLGRGKPRWQVIEKDGTSNFFDSFDNIGNWVIAKTLEPEEFARHLRQYEGYRLKHQVDAATDKETFALWRGKKEVGRYHTYQDLLLDRGDLLPKIDARLGPQLAFVDNNAIQVKYVQGSAIGPYQDMLKHLDGFQAYKVESPYVQLEAGVKGSLRMNKFTKQIEIYLPDIEWRSPMASVKEAKKLLVEGIHDWDLLKEVAAQKGYRLEPMAGRYVLYTDKGASLIANTPEELAETLRKVPIPEWAPELSGLDDIDVLMDKFPKPPENMFQPKEFSMTPVRDSMTAHDIISGFYRPPDQWLVKAIEHGGDQQVLKYFRDVENVRQLLRGEEYKVGQAIHGSFMVEGKMLKKDRRVIIGQYLKTKGEAAKNGVRLNAKMTDGEMRVAERIREIFGGSVEEGLFQKFGVRPDDFLEDYLPRIRKYYQANSWKVPGDGNRHPFLKEVFDNATPPHELDAFFKHQRVSDIIKMAMDDDPLSLLLKYNTIGHRETFLGPLWSEIDGYVRGAGKGMDKKLLKRFQLYRAQVMGLPEGMADEWIRDATAKVWTKMGLPAPMGKDVTRMMMSWGYLAGMGFRPWLPIRNSFQIWTTLAPRIGNDWVAGAVRKVARDSDGTLFKALREKGVLTTHLPVFGTELFESGDFLSKLTHKGLQWYKNSDDFTRVVAYHAARDRFMDAAERLQRMGPQGTEKGWGGKFMTDKDFVRMSGLETMPKDLQAQTADLIRRGKWSAAADAFATNMVTETIFPYRSGMGPIAFKGTVGKLFGMFGTYPVYYIENIKRALKYGSTASKLGYAARFMGNTTALYYLFKEGLGVNANNFIWWVPGDFTGGPYYGMMNQVLEAMDFRSYGGRQARAELKSEIPKWITGFQWNSMMRAYDSFKNGNMYEGLLNLTSAPVNPEWFGEAALPNPGVLFPRALLPGSSS